MRKRSRSRSVKRIRSRSGGRREQQRQSKKSKWSDIPPQEQDAQYLESQKNKQNQNHQAAITISGELGSTQTGSGPLIAPYSLLGQLLNWVHPQTYLSDPTKQKHKILLEGTDKYKQLIRGERNSFRKYLESEFMCKLYLRGENSKNDGINQAEDEEPTHILIVSETLMYLQKCKEELIRILNLQDDQIDKHMELVNDIFQKFKPDPNDAEELIDDIIICGSGNPDAYVMQVPNECLAIIIGKNSETLKMIKNMSGIQKIQISNDGIPGQQDRNAYFTGGVKNYEQAKKLINEIIDKHKQLKQVSNIMGFSQNSLNNQNQVAAQTKQTIELSIPNNMVGLVIGKNGETIKSINQRTGAYVFIPPEVRYGETTRSLTITGLSDQCSIAKREILDIVTLGQSAQGYKMEPDVSFAYMAMQQQKQFDFHVQATKEIKSIPFLEQAFQNAPADHDLTNPFALSGLMPGPNQDMGNDISQYQSALLVYQDMLANQLQASVIESEILDDQTYYAGKSKSQQRNPKYY